MYLLQDPWYNAAQTAAGGLQRGLEEGITRGRAQKTLSGASSLFQPIGYDENNTPIQRPFGEVMLQLAGAGYGIPGFQQYLGEIAPYLQQEYARQARQKVRPQYQGGKGKSLPNGQIPNKTPQHGRGVETLNHVDQQGEPYNETPYAAESGYETPVRQSDQPVVEHPPGRGHEKEFVAGKTHHPETTGPHPALSYFGPEEQESLRQQLLSQNYPPQQIEQAVQAAAQAVESQNKAVIEGQQLNQRDVELNRQITGEQNAYIDNQLDRLSGGAIYDEKGNRRAVINPDSAWQDPQTQRVAKTFFLQARGQKGNETDAKAWREAEANTQRYINTKDNLMSVGGRPEFGNDYKRRYNAMKTATGAYLRSTPYGYNKDTGEYNLEAVNEAIASNMENGWLYEESAEAATPMSKKSIDVIHGAPDMRKVAPIGIAGERNVDNRAVQNAVQKTADMLLKNGMPRWDNMLSLRRQLFMQKGWGNAEFQALVDAMEARGWKPSEYQDEQLGRLQQDINPPLYEIFMGGGRGLKHLFIEPEKL